MYIWYQNTQSKNWELRGEMDKSAIIMEDFKVSFNNWEQALKYLYEYGALEEHGQQTWHSKHIWNTAPSVLPKLAIFWATKQVAHFKGFKSYRLCYLTTLKSSHKSITEIQLENSYMCGK